MRFSFNPRAHGGRDVFDLVDFLFEAEFQSTRPRGARPATTDAMSLLEVFQSTRPRGARRQGFQPRLARQMVSIHAPTGGATERAGGERRRGGGFNPRAHGGRDKALSMVSSAETSFNPRAHGGRDPRHARGDFRQDGVSIHAPTGGATPQRSRACRCSRVSIHAPTGGATAAVGLLCNV